jgi:hypothetical protein
LTVDFPWLSGLFELSISLDKEGLFLATKLVPRRELTINELRCKFIDQRKETSVEKAPNVGEESVFFLHLFGRYGHKENYVQTSLFETGFLVRSMSLTILRMEKPASR